MPRPCSLHQEAEPCDHQEEMDAGEDRICPESPKALPPKADPTTKGQAGDGPEPAESPPCTAGPPEMELEKVRMEFELTRLRYVHEENERQRQHEEVMEQLQQQAPPRLVRVQGRYPHP